MKTKTPNPNIHRLLTAFLALSMTLALSAQQSPSTPETYQEEEEVIVLEEFQVSAASMVNEYVASEALGGTRTGDKIIDIPFNVQVLSSDLIEDFLLMNEYNELPIIPNFSPGDGDDEKLNSNDRDRTHRLRGFNPRTMRDGFSRAGPSNIANTKSVEVIMGPQSALYGEASPGGILNYISKRPRRNYWNRLTLAAGNYGYRRAEFEVNGPAIPNKLYYMFNASYQERKGETDFTEAKTKSYLLGLTYLITQQTSLSVNWEQQFVDSIQGPSVPKLVLDSNPSNPRTTTVVNAGQGIYTASRGVDHGPYAPLRTFNRLGPYQDKESRFDSITALLEHRFNRIFSARLNALYYHRNWDDKTWTSGLQYDYGLMYQGSPVTPRMRTRAPTKRLQTIDNYAVQTDFLSQFKTGPLSHKLLLAADYVKDVYDNQQWQLPSSGSYSPNNYVPNETRYLDPYNPIWWSPDYSQITRYTSNLRREYKHLGASASFRTFALRNKLITNLSTRYTHTDADIRNRSTPAQSGSSVHTGWIYSLGANYKIKGDALVAYINTSSSFEPAVTYDNGLGRPIDPEKGKGYEAGLKGSFLDRKINYTLSLFYIEKQNVRESNPDYTSGDAGTGKPQYITAGEVRSRGGEFVLTTVPVKDLTLITAFGYTDAEITHDDPANDPSTIGERPINVPRITASLLTSYRIGSGVLKGLRLNLSTTFRGDVVSQHKDTKTTNPGKEKYVTPSLFLMSAGASYEIKHTKRIKHSISVNVQNLWDKEYITPGFIAGRGRSYSATYRLNF